MPDCISSFGSDEHGQLFVRKDWEGHNKGTYISGNNFGTYGNINVGLWLCSKANALSILTRIHSSNSTTAIFMTESGGRRQVAGGRWQATW
jgi:hypothetical protein